MFNFLKDKLKGAISKISKRAEEEGQQEEVEAEVEEQPKEEIRVDKKEVKSSLEELDVPKEEKEEHKEEVKQPESQIEVETRETTQPIEVAGPEKVEEKKEDLFDIEKPKVERQKREKVEVDIPTPQAIEKDAKKKVEAPEEKKGFFSRLVGKKEETEQPQQEENDQERKGFFSKVTEKIVTTKINKDKFDDMFSDLEMILLENNVAVEVIDKIKGDLEKDLVDNPIRRNKVEETIVNSLKSSIEDLFDMEKLDLVRLIKTKEEKPFVIAFFGINGSGKTTSIAKLTHLLKEKGFSCVLAAADTFRAASIEQLQIHADKLDVKLIKQDYGSDPAAVAFDAIKHAQSKGIDVVLVDTAGRLQSNTNLMQEMEKIIRVAKPDLKVFVGESITGNDCIEQAKSFNDAVGIDGLILTKADVDEKGGAAISVGYVTKRPIMYVGMGQEYSDLKKFDSKTVIESLGL